LSAAQTVGHSLGTLRISQPFTAKDDSATPSLNLLDSICRRLNIKVCQKRNRHKVPSTSSYPPAALWKPTWSRRKTSPGYFQGLKIGKELTIFSTYLGKMLSYLHWQVSVSKSLYLGKLELSHLISMIMCHHLIFR